MRLFVAVPLPLDIATALNALLPDDPALRRVAPELMHLTIAFLGATPDARLDDVRAAAAEGARGTAPFRATLDHLGRFPEHGAPRVVWVGIGDGAAALVALAERVRRALASRALAFDEKPFRAHATLARVREEADRDSVNAIARALDASPPPRASFEVNAIAVVESVLSSKGPRYTVREAVPLTRG